MGPRGDDRFDLFKNDIVSSLGALEYSDKSPKGSLDVDIIELVKDINAHPNYVTTSSCSGRVSLFHSFDSTVGVEQERDEGQDDLVVPKKGSGKWLAVSHAKTWIASEMEAFLSDVDSGVAVFKCEPFVLHVQCRDGESAQKMLQVARMCGFRESGISMGNKKIMLGIRTCANMMEVPILYDGVQTVTKEGLEVLCRVAETKFQNNRERRERFHKEIRIFLQSTAVASSSSPPPCRDPLWKEINTPDSSCLLRWGQSVTAVDENTALVFGGYGNGGDSKTCHRRLNDIVKIKRGMDGTSWEISQKAGNTSSPSGRVCHSASLLPRGLVIVFGGRHGPTKPCNDAHILDINKMQWLDVATTFNISPRWGHSAETINPDTILIFGGRSAEQLYNDVVSLEVKETGEKGLQVCGGVIDTHGTPPCPRFAHSSAMVGKNIVIYGGYVNLVAPETGDGMMSGDVFLLDSETLTWSCLIPHTPEYGRFSHQAVPLSDTKMLVCGGICTKYRDNSMTVLDIKSKEWTRIESSDRYGEKPMSAMFTKFSLTKLGNHILVVGGGALCFSFGFYFNPMCSMNVHWLCSHDSTLSKNAIAVERSQVKMVKVALEDAGLFNNHLLIAPYGNSMAIPLVKGWTEAQIVSLLPADITKTFVFAQLPASKKVRLKIQSITTKPNTRANSQKKKPCPGRKQERHFPKAETPKVEDTLMIGGLTVLVKRSECKLVKVALEKAELYDRTRRIAQHDTDELVCVPINPEAAFDKVVSLLESLNVDVRVETVKLPLSTRGNPVSSRAGNVPRKENRKDGLRTQISSWLHMIAAKSDCISLPSADVMKKEIPNKIEILGDVSILSTHAFSSVGIWEPVFALGDTLGESFCIWRFITGLMGTKRVLLQRRIDPGGKRASRAKMVFPRKLGLDESIVTVKQNGVIYRFDLEKCMFSSGNISEKQRVARFPCKGSIVVDLFAGIGYFTLPYLVKAGAAWVHACEWNKDALEALRENLKLNNVADSCTVYPGDCRETASQKLKGIADRVNVGLIPTSEPFLQAAVSVLKSSSGGWLHIHENVESKVEKEWVKGLVEKVLRFCKEEHGGDDWVVRCDHVEKVKSYSPFVNHVVADVHCTRGELQLQNARSVSTKGQEKVIYPCREIKPKKHCVQVIPYPKSQVEAQRIFAQGLPVVLEIFWESRTDASFWTAEGLNAFCDENEQIRNKKVSVHVADESCDGKIGFVNKSFKFKVMPFKELLDVTGSTEAPRAYLRAIGPNPRKDRAHFWKDYAELASAGNMKFPADLVDIKNEYFSSVFRVASKGLQLWTHYDVMHNVLFQLSGTKRVVLFQPKHVDALDFHGSSSSIVDIDNLTNIDPDCPFAKARREALEVTLEPGQALFIPALWPHNARADSFSVAVNIFWKHLSDAHYGKKDLYGNRDPILAEKAIELVTKARDILHSAQDDATTLPDEYVDFSRGKPPQLF
eukprot:CAMPEP_0203744342 /NCGR_PEP_ID=MMETSP0098-20131031/449_1 /ASSEMBLY_ACC=CAM_ASM_000208 /TAXON_ID=96639 /ORGANISM=" , Strain NY0313808BC1" /LENGTH=1459 /DNA_ID=CAMNT_0050631839 /DNA_START=263 /DNA_END=4643 /DNA_ORIENTATION=-